MASPEKHPQVAAAPERGAEGIEDREQFEGQRVLVVGGSTAHGVAMAVTSARYLERRGARAEIYVGSPVVHSGKGGTYPGVFYERTLPRLDVGGYDRIVIADISPDHRNVALAEGALIKLTQRLDRDREARKLPKLERPVFFIDYRRSATFTEAWPQEEAEPPAPANVASHGVAMKIVAGADRCRLGEEPSQTARIGSICDRDPATLPVTKEEMILARGLDAAVRPDPDDLKPKSSNPEELSAWEKRTQERLEEAVRQLQAKNWDYFRHEAERIGHIEIPTAGGFGDVAIVDTQELTGKMGVLKLMELAIENAGADRMPYAIGVFRGHADDKMGRDRADVITIIRHWTREDLPPVERVLRERFGEDFAKRHGVYGPANAKSMRLPVSDRETAEIVADLTEAFAGREMPDFRGVRSVVMCGDPNSGKSVYSAILREALRTLGVNTAHLDLDKAAPTPKWYLDAEIRAKEADVLFGRREIDEAKLEEARRALETAASRRRAMKRPWSIELAEEARRELLGAAGSGEHDFVIGDIGGGRIKKDQSGKVFNQRLTAENARILEGADAVIIVSNNAEGAEEWRRLVESGTDPETGVTIRRKEPLRILGVYRSVLEGQAQEVAGGREPHGVITNLDRSKAERIYNPAAFATAVFVSRAVARRQKKERTP